MDFFLVCFGVSSFFFFLLEGIRGGLIGMRDDGGLFFLIMFGCRWVFF